MKIEAFKKRPLSVMATVSQDEAWELVRSLASQMQRNDPNTERKEYMDASGQYLSIAVEPDPVRFLRPSDMRQLKAGFNTLLVMVGWDKKKGQTKWGAVEWLDDWQAILEKMEKIIQ